MQRPKMKHGHHTWRRQKVEETETKKGEEVIFVLQFDESTQVTFLFQQGITHFKPVEDGLGP